MKLQTMVAALAMQAVVISSAHSAQYPKKLDKPIAFEPRLEQMFEHLEDNFMGLKLQPFVTDYGCLTRLKIEYNGPDKQLKQNIEQFLVLLPPCTYQQYY